eukprot:CAMPEP_0119561170 /NCGR_PEP_ID=MMETSP1352-20130426/16902_1 /TAXON_ID=265584 /ORGANISM="Stauroneis constricta, Strain CCMP1120" /LENGTH=507 /DNA_ID=CAMNT_0007609325 /DNA_START=83 /DNA_END=1603 /DNA_ORIENTATION=-
MTPLSTTTTLSTSNGINKRKALELRRVSYFPDDQGDADATNDAAMVVEEDHPVGSVAPFDTTPPHDDAPSKRRRLVPKTERKSGDIATATAAAAPSSMMRSRRVSVEQLPTLARPRHESSTITQSITGSATSAVKNSTSDRTSRSTPAFQYNIPSTMKNAELGQSSPDNNHRIITPFNSTEDLLQQTVPSNHSDHPRSAESRNSRGNAISLAQQRSIRQRRRRSSSRTRRSFNHAEKASRGEAAIIAPRSKLSTKFSIAALAIASLVALYYHHIAPSISIQLIPNSVYVPGGGFSGFWFFLGQLKSLTNVDETNFVCYSAGCLASVSTLQHWSVNRTATLAFSIQHQWETGAITRSEVVPTFVDGLLEDVYNEFNVSVNDWSTTPPVSSSSSPLASSSQLLAPAWLPRVKILTTKPSGRWGVHTVVHTATSIQELRQRLIQSAWIPGATGNDILMEGHMDGAFDMASHPVCTKSVHFPAALPILLNILNPSLSPEFVNWLGEYGERY